MMSDEAATANQQHWADADSDGHLQRLLVDATPDTATATKASPTAAVDPAAPVAGADPAAATGPSADPMEVAALEMVLADPANREMVEHFGGELQPLPTWTSNGKGIEARYGADLGGRLYQLQQAQRAVEGEFFRAMDDAQRSPPQDPLPTLHRPDQPVPTTDRPGWQYSAGGGPGENYTPPSWHYSSELFARQYAAGDSPAQRAFASLHGSDPLKFVPAPDTEVMHEAGREMSGMAVRLGRPLDRDEGFTPGSALAIDGWVPSGLERRDFHLDPNRITKLINNEAVWFDPVQGFMTDPDNLKQSGIDRAFPVVMGAAFAAMGGVAVGLAMGAPTSAAGAVLQGAAVGATGSALNQYVSTGRISFKSVLTSALAGGLTAGVMNIPGVGENLRGATSPVGKLLQMTGKATLQGSIQEVIGGKFKDGFVNGMLAGVAEEVTGWINTEISNTPGLSESQASAFRLLSRATGSAIRMVGSGDPTGAASDFLAGVLGEGVGEASNVTTAGPQQTSSDPLGDFIAENEPYWTARQANYDQILSAFSEERPIDRTADELIAYSGRQLARFAGRGATLLASEMAANGYTYVASEVYFQPDAPSSKPIRIDGVYTAEERKFLFGEAKIGEHADLTRNQKPGLPALRAGAGYFYGANSAALAHQAGVKPDAQGRFRLPANMIQGVYVATYERTRPESNRVRILNDAFRQSGGFGRGAGD